MSATQLLEDKRIPAEIWSEVFSNLYPSQLSRLSLVSKTFYSIVASLNIWIQLFALTHPDRELRVLKGRSASASCMVYMCAVSLHFCESCQKLIPFQQTHAAKLPMPVLIKLPRIPVVTTNITDGRGQKHRLVGNRINLDWRIRMCLECRNETSTATFDTSPPNYFPPHMDERRYEWVHEYPQLLVTKSEGLKSNDKRENVLKHLNKSLGGPAGVEAARKPTRTYDEKTWSRMLWYQVQE
ncbi:hypothetical protein EMPS_07319 [Entomortierella parvispora]|uniref:F-box domain-containing protein n=1 Tax=Entomortierella parvispora TaxID=205924 RepID=A0A9P3HDW5_9FUNG|nr:hypothetical protein EMPS_07319 [Entomortierella parvispora]